MTFNGGKEWEACVCDTERQTDNVHTRMRKRMTLYLCVYGCATCMKLNAECVSLFVVVCHLQKLNFEAKNLKNKITRPNVNEPEIGR